MCFRTIAILAVLFTSLGHTLEAQGRKTWDGPYISLDGDEFEVKWIEKGRRKKANYPIQSAGVWSVENLPKVNIRELSVNTDDRFEYTGVDRFAAISDIHGQYDVMLKLLKTHGIVDAYGNWSYGTGHLVVLGDIFDRGDKVTECLWFIFFLQKQASAAGGKVHFLLGNHELMVLHGDKRYLHPKYMFTAGKMRTPYHELFSENTILGRWLRTRKVSISINDIVFVHGGFSKKVIDRENSIGRLNEIFRDQIIPNPGIEEDDENFVSELYFENGPLWYRGLAQPQNFDIDQAEYILSRLGKETLVIGHTSMPQVISLYENRVVLIDSSIKFGKSGELLMYDNELLYRAKYDGERLLLHSNQGSVQDNSLFDYIVDIAGDDIKLVARTEFDSIVLNKEEEVYRDAVLEIHESGDVLYTLEGRVRTRGNMRKKLCEIPPIKFDFNKKNLRSYGFSSIDKLKLVLPCLEGEENQHFLYREQLIYELYRVIDTLGLRTKIVNMRFEQPNDSIRTFPVFLLEDDDQLAARIRGDIIGTGVIQPAGLNRLAYLKMVFFQFMIANSDWSISSRHNIYPVKLPGEDRLVAIPYDFDYAGIVNQAYAESSSAFPRMDISNRKLRIRKMEEGELEQLTDYFFSIRNKLETIVDKSKYLSKDDRKRFEDGIDEFYRILENPDRLPAYMPDVRVR